MGILLTLHRARAAGVIKWPGVAGAPAPFALPVLSFPVSMFLPGLQVPEGSRLAQKKCLIDHSSIGGRPFTIGDAAMVHLSPVGGLPGRGEDGTGARKELEEEMECPAGAS